jgi:hypothetical protein
MNVFAFALFPESPLRTKTSPKPLIPLRFIKEIAHFLITIDAQPDSEDACFSWFGLRAGMLQSRPGNSRCPVELHTVLANLAEVNIFLATIAGRHPELQHRQRSNARAEVRCARQGPMHAPQMAFFFKYSF